MLVIAAKDEEAACRKLLFINLQRIIRRNIFGAVQQGFWTYIPWLNTDVL